MSKSKELVKQEVQFSVSSVKSQVEELSEICSYLIENKLVPSGITPAQLTMMVNTGRELGMNPITAVNSIDIIQGRLSLQARIIPALLAQKGVYINVLEDYQPIYEEVSVPMKDPETKEVITDEDGKIKFYKDENGEVLKRKKIVDRITTVEFTRIFPNGITRVGEISFTWSMAKDAGWDTKPNWQKMPAYMMMARAISRGARIYASDCIHGMYDNYEIMDAFVDDNDIEVTEEGEVYYTEQEAQSAN